MWTEFEKPLFGAKKQGEFSYDLHFPVSHVDQSFAGKDVAVKVKVLKVSAAKMPSDEEVLKNTAFTDKGGIDGLRNHIKITMERELKYALAEKYNANVITKLLELVPIEVPKGLIDMESQRRCDDMAAKLQKMSGFNKKPTHLKKEFFTGEATRTVTAGIILAKIIHDQKIAITPEEVQAKLGEIATETDSSRKDELVQSYNQNKTLLTNIENLLVEEKALNFVKQQMQVVDKQISIAEALQR
jgi:trigger factor